MVHVPVMLNEIVEALRVKRSGIYVDGTVGLGGHAEGILRKAEGECTLIGMDRDEEALEIAGKRLKDYDVQLMKDNFSNMEDAVKGLGYKEVDGILLDLGLSTLQLKAEGRGFSFLRDDPLDMRMDTAQELTAANIVNEYPEKDLANVLWKYGEERFSRKIARAIVNARQRKTIKTCKELALIIEKAVKRRGRIHPATRAFQTLRIEVNKELTLLSMALDAGINLLGPKGRLCVLSYHSLEDRIVKHSFKDMAKKGVLTIITKRPLTPQKEERDANPSSRSAKLRVAEKL
ncbi:MAG TPA: 16S rRNA (cytosine(1402)-N(4))-methyltransferase RsmH [Nitrospirae bacterium]|nr:16S rRNA (cytosine(1402)-N(4))-methyltransferase RsmH [Nitrospirota bacterium]